MIRTHKNYLIDVHGMDPSANPRLPCACGVMQHSDMLIDITSMPIGIRKAFGLHRVDFICDGCQTRLFRELHISEQEFYSLCGQDDPAALAQHGSRDPFHQHGVDLRPVALKPPHAIVTKAHMVGKTLSQVGVSAPMRVRFRSYAHLDGARYVHNDPDSGLSFAAFAASGPSEEVSLSAAQPTMDILTVSEAPVLAEDDLPADQPATLT